MMLEMLRIAGYGGQPAADRLAEVVEGDSALPIAEPVSGPD